MRRLRRAALGFVVWLTAVSTLLGNVPHFVCHCPDGTVKSFCFGSAPADSTVKNQFKCCCGGACCSQTQVSEGCCRAVETPAASYCCQNSDNDSRNADPEDDSPPFKGPSFSRTSCQKTLAMPDDGALIRPGAKANLNLPSYFAFLAISMPGAVLSLCPARSNQDWRVSCLPPPTDLVTVLQRLTI